MQTYEEYDPTRQDHPKDSNAYGNYRPESRWQSDFNLGKLFQMWPDYPEQIVRYGKYLLKFSLVEQESPSLWSRAKHTIGLGRVSIDGKTWYEWNDLKYSDYKHMQNKMAPPPSWWDKKELVDAVHQKVAEYKKVRSRMLAEKREIALKKEAKEKGVDFEKYKQAKTEKNKKERAKQLKHNTGMKMADQLNRKMKVAMVLKELRDATEELQSKLEDETLDMPLSYVDNNINKISEALRAIKILSRSKVRKNRQK